MDTEGSVDRSKPHDEEQAPGSLETRISVEMTKSQTFDRDSNFFARTLVRRYEYIVTMPLVFLHFHSTRRSGGGIWGFGVYPMKSDSAEGNRIHRIILRADLCAHYLERIRAKSR